MYRMSFKFLTESAISHPLFINEIHCEISSISTKLSNMSLEKECSAYPRVSDDEDLSRSFLPSTDPRSVARSRYFREYVSLGYLWLLHGILVATYLLIAIRYLQTPKVHPLRGFFSKFKYDGCPFRNQ